jgi:hypothetical protein
MTQDLTRSAGRKRGDESVKGCGSILVSVLACPGSRLWVPFSLRSAYLLYALAIDDDLNDYTEQTIVTKRRVAALMLALVLTTPAVADELNTRAALGGGLGGALGAFVGSEMGGRNGAVLGGGLGGALGSVVATDGYRERRYVERHYYYPSKHKKHKKHHRRGRRHGDWDD